MTKAKRGVIGWREWVSLPDLGVERIKAKVDTGARSSSLHAFEMHRFERDGMPMVEFSIHPIQRHAEPSIRVEAPITEERHVRNSGGRQELRPVIVTRVAFGREAWPIELTLTRRDEMGFRMLLGRQAVRGRWIVDPGRSFVTGRPLRSKRS